MTKLRAAIKSTCFAVPDHFRGNDFFEKLPDLRNAETGEMKVKATDEWITKMVGVKRRGVAAENEYASDLAYKAAKPMFEASDIKPKDIDGIIVATSTADRTFPSTACILQEKFDMRTDIFAYDLVAACSGFLAALDTAKNAIESSNAKYVLVMAAETLSKINDYTSPNCPLFGDGAAGVILGPDVEGRGIVSVVRKSDPYEGHLYSVFKGSGKFDGPKKEAIFDGGGFNQGTLRMPDGSQVLKFAIREMGAAIEKAIEKAGWTLDEVALAICHQANIRIAIGLGKRFPQLNFYNNIHNYGNMSAVTCGGCLDEALRADKLKSGDKLLMTSFASGEITYAITHQF